MRVTFTTPTKRLKRPWMDEPIDVHETGTSQELSEETAKRLFEDDGASGVRPYEKAPIPDHVAAVIPDEHLPDQAAVSDGDSDE